MKKSMLSAAALGFASAVTVAFAQSWFQCPPYDPIPYSPAWEVAATSEYDPDGRLAINAINAELGIGKGLDANGLHNTTTSQMWLTHQVGSIPGTYYCVDFHDEIRLSALKLWNYNENNYSSRGIREVKLYTAASDVENPDPNELDDWTFLMEHEFERAKGSNGDEGCALLEFPATVKARHFMFKIQSSHPGGDAHLGFSKVQFYELPPFKLFVEGLTRTNAFLGSSIHLAIPDMDVTVFWAFKDQGTDAAWTAAPGFGTATPFSNDGIKYTALANGLTPGTDYEFRYMAVSDSGATTNWSGLGTFTTWTELPVVTMTKVYDVLISATVDVQLLWPGEFETADILFLYAGNDWEDVAEDWLNDPGVEISFHAGVTPGEHSFVLPLTTNINWHCRAFAINAFATNAAPEGVTFASAINREGDYWVWSGVNSGAWSDTGNWVLPASLANPGDIEDIQGKKIHVGLFPNSPTDQDIEPLELDTIYIEMPGVKADLVFDGKPITLANRITRELGDGYQAPFSIVFHNDIILAAGDPDEGYVDRPVHFYGKITELGKRIFRMDSGTGVHLHGPVEITGGFANAHWRPGTYYYGMKTTGGTPDAYNPFFFSGKHYFMPPPGVAEYEYDFPPEKGVGGYFYGGVAENCMAVFNAPVVSGGDRFENIGDLGIFMFNAPVNTMTDLFFFRSGLMIIKGEIPPGAALNGYFGSIEFNGQDILGRNLNNYNSNGHNGDGVYRNQNPDKRSHFDGNTLTLGTYTCHQFGGVGDILYSGDILDPNREGDKRFSKVGPGTLTMTGKTWYDSNPMSGVLGGALVLDYETNNGVKLAESSYLVLSGKLDLLGNPNEDTVQTVGDLYIGQHGFYSRTRISPSGRNSKSATFRFGNLYFAGSPWDSDAAVDFAPGENGHIRTQQTNNENLNALSARATYKGKSFARVSDAPPVDGYSLVEPIPDGQYHKDINSAPFWSFVDIAGDTVNTARMEVAAIRFNKPATLTLERELNLLGEFPEGYPLGGLLVTPDAGNDPVVINGPGLLCFDRGAGCFTIHQYNTNAALVINAQIYNWWGTGVIKTGPGELVLTHTNNCFNRISVLEGTLVFDLEGPVVWDDNGNTNLNSSIGNTMPGHQKDLIIGDATIRYVGAGHETNRRFALRGFGVIEAEGSGPLVFTNEAPVINSGNQLLTLSGKKQGVITGSLRNLAGGRLRKRGTGTWTLTETSHSPRILWGADVMEGTLVLDGSLGYDVTVYPGGTLAGSGKVHRDLFVKEGGALFLDPAAPMQAGQNVRIENGAELKLPPAFRDTVFTPVLVAGGKITGEFSKIHPFIRTRCEGGVLEAKYQPSGTLFMVR